mmetsp:Transcript_26320/g.39019  ORF Transcript_26320/g.39019 Transcript_26320/m.39019 type:complete len:220 (+) Transcript_26320:524-1183(+)
MCMALQSISAKNVAGRLIRLLVEHTADICHRILIHGKTVHKMLVIYTYTESRILKYFTLGRPHIFGNQFYESGFSTAVRTHDTDTRVHIQTKIETTEKPGKVGAISKVHIPHLQNRWTDNTNFGKGEFYSVFSRSFDKLHFCLGTSCARSNLCGGLLLRSSTRFTRFSFEEVFLRVLLGLSLALHLTQSLLLLFPGLLELFSLRGLLFFEVIVVSSVCD